MVMDLTNSIKQAHLSQHLIQYLEGEREGSVSSGPKIPGRVLEFYKLTSQVRIETHSY